MFSPQTATLMLVLFSAGFALALIALSIVLLRSALAIRRIVHTGTAISTQERDRLCMTGTRRFAIIPAIFISVLSPTVGRLMRHAGPVSPILLHDGVYLFLAIIE